MAIIRGFRRSFIQTDKRLRTSRESGNTSIISVRLLQTRASLQKISGIWTRLAFVLELARTNLLSRDEIGPITSVFPRIGSLQRLLKPSQRVGIIFRLS